MDGRPAGSKERWVGLVTATLTDRECTYTTRKRDTQEEKNKQLPTRLWMDNAQTHAVDTVNWYIVYHKNIIPTCLVGLGSHSYGYMHTLIFDLVVSVFTAWLVPATQVESRTGHNCFTVH